MAQYKVPQDVEADDKLLGPFNFRQFVYLMIAGGAIALMVGLFQLFPILAILPLPVVLFFGALALPLKKDQPMETYMAALASYYLKQHKRVWMPGQQETMITIAAPKLVDDNRSRDITGEEATHRLSFLANIVDTEGYSIKGEGSGTTGTMSAAIVAETAQAHDMFEMSNFNNLESTITRGENSRHQEIIQDMKKEIERADAEIAMGTVVPKSEVEEKKDIENKPNFESEVVVTPNSLAAEVPVEKSGVVEKMEEKQKTIAASPGIMELANNTDYSVATIAKEANRIKEREEGEVFISLH